MKNENEMNERMIFTIQKLEGLRNNPEELQHTLCFSESWECCSGILEIYLLSDDLSDDFVTKIHWLKYLLLDLVELLLTYPSITEIGLSNGVNFSVILLYFAKLDLKFGGIDYEDRCRYSNILIALDELDKNLLNEHDLEMVEDFYKKHSPALESLLKAS